MKIGKTRVALIILHPLKILSNAVEMGSAGLFTDHF
jgi:hypothetical protein